MAARGRGRPARLPSGPCPNPLHGGSRVAAYGTRRTSAGVQRRYRCRPVGRDAHIFAMLVSADGRMRPVWSAAPACPTHEHGRVARFGSYGQRTAKPRQRYRCVYGQAPDGKPLWHTFTPPLPREHVHEADSSCAECEQLRGVHHGDTAVARRHARPTRVVARGLEQLSMGASYADVSRWALRTAEGRARGRHSSGCARQRWRSGRPTTPRSRPAGTCGLRRCCCWTTCRSTPATTPPASRAGMPGSTCWSPPR